VRFPTAETIASKPRILSVAVACLLLTAVSMIASATPGPGPYGGGELSVMRHFVVFNGLRRVPGQWGELGVPENRNNPRSRQVQVTFGRLQSTGDNAGVPIFFIAGGPGASAIGSFAGNAEWLCPHPHDLPLRR
jgi:hypothetical protein